MFKNSVKTFLATAALVAGTTFSIPAFAEWPGFDGQVYSGGGFHNPHVGSRFKHKQRPHYDHGYNRHHGHKFHGKKRVRHQGRCGPRRALRKAWNLGLNRPHIARLNKKRIVVVGYNHGHAAKVVFKRKSSHCRVIKTRGLY